jgi:O-antigen/teichoic acid export membrane protein
MNKESLGEQFKYSVPMYLSSIVGKIGNHLDKLVLMLLLSSDDFALYAVGNFRIPMITILYTSIGNVIIQRLSNYSKSGNTDGTITLWKKMINKNALVTVPIVLFFIVVAKEFITLLFTQDYELSVNVFRITILVFFIQMLGYGYILRAYAKTANVLYANLTRFIISLVICFPLIKYLGINGAAIAFTLSFSINGILQLIRSKKLLNVSWKNFLPWKFLLRVFTISILSLAPVVILQFFNLNKALFLVISGMLYFGIVLLIYLKKNYLNLKNIQDFMKI